MRPVEEVPEGFHVCPGPECHAVIPFRLLACVPHWRQVPSPAQKAVYAAWNGGKGRGTMKHLRAIEAAIAAMTPLRKGGRG